MLEFHRVVCRWSLCFAQGRLRTVVGQRRTANDQRRGAAVPYHSEESF
jgi:hypothetical protein